ncbi:methanogenesis marker 12 protein [Methanoculleus sp. 7T]|jgi:putative methanogenesis marker protein 12|uniref:methanogenesis marker 12 protein n=1 Tax=Methanoculleus sp. 7T TaxID=2937282 RepID=UPI0020BE9968|nr:methanogenesis marker 12 protein [Methanoculleus sp. 7T]MCK8517897.1 methanogenesis marker 12 protein [Methanoculleus sp. 7T]
MFIGIDHGTTAMRFSTGTQEFKISREEARHFSVGDLGRLCPLDEIEGIAVCYSMGDGISAITDIRKVKNRGIISREGAGKHIGGGTRVYDQIRESGLPAVVIPGLHRGSPTDPRFKAYSHQASPEKVGILYEVSRDLGNEIVVCDASSNTVTLLVTGGRITGAFDACLFAPGTQHGALDVDAIRRIDRGDSTANDAFLHAGVNYTVPPELRIETAAMFAAMECASMLLLNPGAKVALAGSLAPAIASGVKALLSREVAVYDEWCAARGLARIARDVFSGASGILGLAVDR